MSVKHTLVRYLEQLLPRKLTMRLRYQFRRLRRQLDPELFLLDSLLDARRGFVDIGANVGLYTYYFSHSFQNIYSFEPISEKAPPSGRWNQSDVTVYTVALSDQHQVFTLYIPEVSGRLETTLASLEPRDGICHQREVTAERLDAYNLREIDLIKIDVEGHERRVIDGAVETIRVNRPILLVEIEQRHSERPIEQVFDQIRALGYTGYFIQGRERNPLETFSVETHQNPHKEYVNNDEYVNNFLFLPDSESEGSPPEALKVPSS